MQLENAIQEAMAELTKWQSPVRTRKRRTDRARWPGARDRRAVALRSKMARGRRRSLSRRWIRSRQSRNSVGDPCRSILVRVNWNRDHESLSLCERRPCRGALSKLRRSRVSCRLETLTRATCSTLFFPLFAESLAALVSRGGSARVVFDGITMADISDRCPGKSNSRNR